jgi:hypothetical protein
MHGLLWRLLSPLPDRLYCMIKYRVIRGRVPDLRSPATFTEKIQARKIYDRNPLFPRLVDKHAGKAFIADRVGERHVIPTQWVGTDLNAVDWDTIVFPVVAKPTHASGIGRMLYTRADADALLGEAVSAAWLAIDHAAYNREWAYSQVPPGIILETMLLRDGRVPWDYRLHVFGGRVLHIELDIRADGQGWHCSFSRDWEKLPFHDPHYLPFYHGTVPRPPWLDEMIRIAEATAAGLDFARVDLYASDDGVYVGEITLYPSGGFEIFDPPEYDAIIGAHWNLAFTIPGKAGNG